MPLLTGLLVTFQVFVSIYFLSCHQGCCNLRLWIFYTLLSNGTDLALEAKKCFILYLEELKIIDVKKTYCITLCVSVSAQSSVETVNVTYFIECMKYTCFSDSFDVIKLFIIFYCYLN